MSVGHQDGIRVVNQLHSTKLILNQPKSGMAAPMIIRVEMMTLPCLGQRGPGRVSLVLMLVALLAPLPAGGGHAGGADAC